MPVEEDKNAVYAKIKSYGIMWKFRFYGFFKNLRFFEPYLIIMYLAVNLNLFQIGTLFFFREVVTYLLEVPSGILADNYGQKRILLSCFIMYIISFILFFIFFGNPVFWIAVLANVLFGLGEAFRSGTHKAMELIWMEREGYLDYKSFVYGLSRSYSLLGSTLSSLLSIIFILNIPADRWIFIITVIPYIIDFILISTYPSYMNETHRAAGKGKMRDFWESIKKLGIIFRDRKLGSGLLSSSLFDAIYKTLKDYIQPIMKLFIAGILLNLAITADPAEQKVYLKIILGIIYAAFYLVSSFSSRNAYRVVEKYKNEKAVMDLIFDFLGILLILNAVFIWIDIPLVVIFLYLVVYVIYNLRRPVVVGYLGTIIPKDQRATILSVDSQLKSIFVFIFAPVFGYIADTFSIPVLFVILGVIIIIFNRAVLSRSD